MAQNYRQNTSQVAELVARFHDQMADVARAERLLELRAATHLSREAAAAEIGVTAKTLYSWEHGGRIRWPNALKLADYYRCDPETLVDRDPPSTPRLDTIVGPTPSQLDRIELALAEILAAVTTRPVAERPKPTGKLGRVVREQEPIPEPRQPARKKRAQGGKRDAA